MRILVTGIAGFVGRHLLRHLAGMGEREVHGGDRGPIEQTENPDELRTALASYRPVDVTDAAAIGDWVRETRPDAIVHLAAQASGADSIQQPALTYRVNALGGLNILEAARLAAPSAVVLMVGSADIYRSGTPGSKIQECGPLYPRNPYALSKAAQDALAELYATAFGVRAVRTRTFTHTGPGQRPQFALAGFADQLARIDAGQNPPELRVGNLAAVREYGDVRDVVRAYRTLLDCGEPGEAYNVCTGRGYVLRELVDRLREVSGVRAPIVIDPARLRAGDTDHLVGDPSKLEKRTGWTPTFTIEQTLADLYREARERVRRETGH